MFLKFFIFAFLCSNLTQALAFVLEEDVSGMWEGIEIVGADKDIHQLIREHVPIKKGDAFSSADPNFNIWCDTIKEKVQNNVRCSFLAFPGRKFYFVVAITNNEIKNNFRTIPTSEKNHIKLEERISILFENFEQTNARLFTQGIFPLETFNKGYIEYNIPELQEFTESFAKLAKFHNQNLLDVIEYSTDPELRAEAATLLSWSQTPENLEYVIDHDLLRDPDEGVRNDLTRSISFFLSGINDPLVLKKALPAFCDQAKLISMTDRNKALHSIEVIVSKYPKLTEMINGECEANLKNIVQTSILPNVGGFAEQILKVKWKFKNEKHTYLNR